VSVLSGASGGPSTAGDQLFYQGVGGIPDTLETNDGFGSALAACDFDADGAGDLVVGMPGEDIDKLRDAGAVAYHQGPLGPESRRLHADSAGVPGAAEPGERFGAALGPGPLGG
jgi:hypothetical protein